MKPNVDEDVFVYGLIANAQDDDMEQARVSSNVFESIIFNCLTS